MEKIWDRVVARDRRARRRRAGAVESRGDTVDGVGRRHRIPRGFTLLDPVRDPVARHDRIRTVAVHPIIRVGRVERRPLEGLELHHGVIADRIGTRGLAHIAVVLKRTTHPKRQLVLHQHTVRIEVETVAAQTVRPRPHLRAILRRIGGRRNQVERATRAAEAEDIRVRTTTQFDALDIEWIDGREAGKADVAEGEIRRTDATYPVRAAGVVLDVISHAPGVVDGEVRVITRALGADRIEEDIVDIEHREIGHLLLRHDRDGRADIFEFRIETCTGHRVSREIALHVGRDFKGAELHRDVAGCPRRGRRCA